MAKYRVAGSPLKLRAEKLPVYKDGEMVKQGRGAIIHQVDDIIDLAPDLAGKEHGLKQRDIEALVSDGVLIPVNDKTNHEAKQG